MVDDVVEQRYNLQRSNSSLYRGVLRSVQVVLSDPVGCNKNMYPEMGMDEKCA